MQGENTEEGDRDTGGMNPSSSAPAKEAGQVVAAEEEEARETEPEAAEEKEAGVVEPEASEEAEQVVTAEEKEAGEVEAEAEAVGKVPAAEEKEAGELVGSVEEAWQGAAIEDRGVVEEVMMVKGKEVVPAAEGGGSGRKRRRRDEDEEEATMMVEVVAQGGRGTPSATDASRAGGGGSRRGQGADGGGGGAPGADGGTGGHTADGHAHYNPNPVARLVLFDEERCRRLVDEERWAQLDVYMCEFLRAVGESVDDHPVLMLGPRQEFMVRMLRDVGSESAIAYFKTHILPLCRDVGRFVPLSGYLRAAIAEIQGKLLLKGSRASWPCDKESFTEEIFDYIRLYFPASIRHDQTHGRKENPAWNLTMILTDKNGNERKYLKKTCYRCLACGWDKGSTSGIKAQSSHLLGQKGHMSCSMTTPRVFELFGVPVPLVPLQWPTNLLKRWTRQRQVRLDSSVAGSNVGHGEDHSQATNSGCPLLVYGCRDDQAPPALEPSELPQLQNPNLEDIDDHEWWMKDTDTLDICDIFLPDYFGPEEEMSQTSVLPGGEEQVLPGGGEHELPGGEEQERSMLPVVQEQLVLQTSVLPTVDSAAAYLDVMTVLTWRGRVGRFVNTLQRFFPVPDAVITLRRSLQEMLKCCSNATMSGRRMVLMSLIQQELWNMRDAFGLMDELPFLERMIERPDILEAFSLINGELDLMEQLCFTATPLPAPPASGQASAPTLAPTPPGPAAPSAPAALASAMAAPPAATPGEDQHHCTRLPPGDPVGDGSAAVRRTTAHEEEGAELP